MKSRNVPRFGNPCANLYRAIENATTYEDAISTLERIFVKQKNEFFARRVLATRSQKSEETLEEYYRSLHELVKDCDFQAATADRNRGDAIRDSLISGLRSGFIRQRLLENKRLRLSTTFERARTLDHVQQNAESYSQSQLMAANRQKSSSSNSSDDVGTELPEENTLSSLVGKKLWRLRARWSLLDVVQFIFQTKSDSFASFFIDSLFFKSFPM